MNKFIRLIPILLCLATFTACQQEEDPADGTETTTIRLNIGGLTANIGQAETRYVDSSPYEGLRTLRVIVTNPEMTKIYYNQKTDVIEDPQNPASATATHSVTIPVPIGTVRFYVIANEESIGKKYTNETLLNDEKQNNKLLFIDEQDPRFFPKKGTEIKSFGLPMSGSSLETISKDTKEVKVSLKRAVTKISLTIENATNSRMTLKDVIFGSFFGDRFYVFPESNLDVPDNSDYAPLNYNNVGFTIEPNTTSQPLSLYFYPTNNYKGTTSPYTLGINTEAHDYQPQEFAPGVRAFSRNTQVNIRAKITTTVGLTINYAVQEWDDYTVDVPDFK